ncbi:hypothetical protein BU25DRAFT_423788 [Macroventuria anomochaeta]|uniref:Uncharacterized protein n=1 Tax=Macroventuria anomochaeta TaxID=301207 RepID=A0ACB6RSI5_9PLEO|nr:uncharacterized protein BU25DRAFT_423788 [Macroventuria anomochaeta]KAF2624662.1 hypothetical protein BU25DRAFT_423788 [Macroventuria anomochaeta]
MGSQDDAESQSQHDIPKTKQALEGEEGATNVNNVAAGNVADIRREEQKRDIVSEHGKGESAQSTCQYGLEESKDVQGTRAIGGGGNGPPAGLRDTTMQQDAESSRPPSPALPGRNSLDDIQQWSQAWRARSTTGASQLMLPLSTSTSLVSVLPPKTSKLQAKTSLEELELRPEAIPLPERSRRKQRALVFSKSQDGDNWSGWGGAWGVSIRRRKTKTVVPPPAPRVTTEMEVYRYNIEVLANRLTNFENVAATATRHRWSPRIVYYDRLKSAQDHAPRRYEPWESRSTAPSFEEFYGTLRNVSNDCNQRIVLVEDLTPTLVDLLGATFQIPPHVIEEHLERSGYKKGTEGADSRVAWHTRSSAQGYSSVTWYRPVLSLVPITSRFRSKLIRDRKPRVRCPFDGCQNDGHYLRLNTQANIWRRQLDLCPDPGVYHKDSDTEYPVGWEEKATIWMREYDGCRFVILLLDPLPIVSVNENIGAGDRQLRRTPPTLANLWIRREDKRARPRGSRTQGPSQGSHVQAWATSLPQDLPPPPGQPLPSLPNMPEAIEITPLQVPPRASGVQTGPTDTFSPAVLRRRATRPDIENASINSIEAVVNTQSSDRRKSVAFAPPPPPVPGQSATSMQPSSRNIEEESLSADTHGPFVPYHPVKARSSSSAWGDDTLHMRAYIESLQVPRSTIDEFEYFLNQPGKGKEAVFDPFRALFRAIHDDTHCLVDIIRVSLQRIREGTLDEDLMQKRVSFWRGLLHSLNFNLEELEQRLRGFVHFAYESEHHSTPSETLAKDTRQTLRACMELIDRSSRSLLAEMQIVDSRRSIAEAESVSKLTELAFVFIPLSFVASLFSMQVHELNGGVPLYTFALVAIGFVLIAYAVRLSIRSSRLIEQKNKMVQKMRDESNLQHNDQIPTHTFLVWASRSISFSIFKSIKDTVTFITPFILVFAVLAAILSPIVLLWLRGINKGFSAVITVIMLLLDLVLVLPVVLIDGGIAFDPRAHINEIKRNHQINKKLREKIKKKKRLKAGLDPEVGDDDDSSSDDDDVFKIANGSDVTSVA